MSSDNEASQLSSPVQYDTLIRFFFQELASDGPPRCGGGGWTRGGWTWGGEGTMANNGKCAKHKNRIHMFHRP